MAFLMTHSLLSAWLYSMKENPFADATTEDTAKEDFLRVLRREPTPTTEAMQKGIDFENLVTDICQQMQPVQASLLTGRMDEGDTLPEELKKHQWFIPALKVAKTVRGGQFQVAAYQRVEIGGYELLLYGRVPGAGMWLWGAAMAGLVFALGAWVFSRLQKTFIYYI